MKIPHYYFLGTVLTLLSTTPATAAAATCSSSAQACSITSATIAAGASLEVSGVKTFCACGPTQYDISTAVQGKSTYIACVLKGPLLSMMSTIAPTTTEPRPETSSLTQLLCATKAPSAKGVNFWGSIFKLSDASAAVDAACDLKEPFRLGRQTGRSQNYYYDQKIVSRDTKKGVNLILAATARDGCDISLDSKTCREIYNTILSGHPSCPNKDNWSMGGIGVSECGNFMLTAGTSYDKRDPFADMHPSRDWNTDHYCDAKLSVKCELDM
ncbi:uncharacterized protein ATNIH1004_001867 [Aspergillus tanneri]|uniref:Cyanovirin-N domain-containing protein n=2 Tax=Aspergillus tanneri TaxID=1220188 RepID=A0A5M9M2Y3_9EURO|nr:uncharacterized protein ATNIH1004_001867 [Aspergillus tanneri]KAA8641402.1 hypothetical protein ATNIH1004_001867 [Aspergillus tanneri]